MSGRLDCEAGGKCKRATSCEHACELRIAHLAARDDVASVELDRIGQSIGYGNAQSILGKAWDHLLNREYGASPGRGQMGVTASETAAYRAGWDACMAKWADHMRRMAKACK